MSKWFKQEELTEDFYGDCFVAVKHNGEIYCEVNCVKKVEGKAYWYDSLDDGWELSNQEEDCLRFFPIKYPEISLEDFK